MVLVTVVVGLTLWMRPGSLAAPPPDPGPPPPPPPPDCAVEACIALTFDDGPVGETVDVLDALAEREAKGTFYVTGTNARDRPEVLRRIHDDGHEIGNHTWDHADLTRLGAEGVHGQMQDTADAVVAATGTAPTTMRPPYGATDDTVAAAVGLPQVLWSLDTWDWRDRDTDVVVERVLASAQPGGIVLLHDIHATTRAAVAPILDGLDERGFVFVTVSQMVPDMQPGAVYRTGTAPAPQPTEPPETAPTEPSTG